MRRGRRCGRQEVGEVVLARQNDGEIRFGVSLELGEGVELGIDCDPREGGLVDHEHGLLLAFCRQIQNLAPDGPQEHGPREGVGFDFELDSLGF
jgi:hypothetical protein